MVSNSRYNGIRRKGKGNPSYVIVHDGETEEWYLRLMKQEENIRKHIDFKHFGGSLTEIYQKVQELFAESYTQIFWIIDFDTIVKEEKNRSHTSISPLQQFIEIKNDAQKYANNLIIAVNNPCLEFWYLLHYQKTGKYYPQYEPELKVQLRKYLPNYKKKEDFYMQGNNLYKRLKPYQPTGIQNASSLPPFDGTNPSQASAEIYKVVNHFLTMP